jgi:hypothetical protein
VTFPPLNFTCTNAMPPAPEIPLERLPPIHTLRYRPSPHETARFIVMPGLEPETSASVFDQAEEARQALREKGFCYLDAVSSAFNQEVWGHPSTPFVF